MFRAKQRVLLIKKEGTAGTDSVPVVASDSFQARNVKISYGGDLLNRDLLEADISQVQPIIGKRKTTISFETELKGSGTAGAVPQLSDLFLACGYAETISVGSSVTYDPTSVNHSTVTIYLYDIQESGSSFLHKVTGARGNCKISLEAGKFGVMAWNFEGIYNTPADVAAPGTCTFESTTPPVVQAMSFALNSVSTLVAQKLEIDLGNELVERDDLNATTALKEIFIGSRKPTGNFAPEAVLAATYDFFGDWVAATSRALTATVGSVAGNKCTITAPVVSIDNIADGERTAILTREMPIRFSRSAGNDELKFNFF